MKTSVSTRVPLLCILIASLGTLAACSSTARELATEDRTVPLYGMIYDNDSSPVAGAQVRVDGTARTKSDVNGRFVLTELAFGRYAVTVEKEHFESARLDLDYTSPGQVLYVKLLSADELLAAAEKDVGRREWAAAEEQLERVLALRHDDPAARYLSAVVAFRRGDSAAARSILEALIAADYREPSVYLFLADILQFKEGDAAAAAVRLREYLQLRYDPDVERRLAGLTAATPRGN